MATIIREPDELLGELVGGYRLARVLGTGMTGAVYLGHRGVGASGGGPEASTDAEVFTPLPAEAAIKVLLLWRVSGAERDEFTRRFKREAQTLQRLRHPHILPVITFGEDAQMGLLYMVLPVMRGGGLLDLLTAGGGRLALTQASEILTQLSSALDYAHSLGVIHRDIKPANVLLDEHGAIQLADFSIARITQDATTQTTVGKIFGSIHYMAPEQLRGEQVGPAADIYGLGALLYQMITGQVPFKADSLVDLAVAQVQQQPVAPRLLRPDLPPLAGNATLQALATSPQQRFASAGALAQAYAAGLLANTGDASPIAAVGGIGATAAGNAPTEIQYTPPPTIQAPGEMRPRSTARGGAVMGLVVLLVIASLLAALAIVSTRGQANLSASLPATSSQATATPSPTATNMPSPPPAPGQYAALVPAGAQVYGAIAPGMCDTNGGQWVANAAASQVCTNGALVMSEPNCNCQLGVLALASMPGQSYLTDYVAQVVVQAEGGDPTAEFGFKFDQQSLQDSGQGRGGYAFMVDANGLWQFIRYAPNGPQTVVLQHQLSGPLSGPHTLDLAVHGATFTFYLDGTLLAEQSDATYTSGYLCVAAQPGATAAFSQFAVYAP